MRDHSKGPTGRSTLNRFGRVGGDIYAVADQRDIGAETVRAADMEGGFRAWSDVYGTAYWLVAERRLETLYVQWRAGIEIGG